MQRLIDQLPLRRGAHPTRDEGMCAMEMVAWLAGEAHSDEPRCACPVLTSLVRACNDSLTDAMRNRYLRPLVPRLVNTRRTAAVERARGLLAVDCVVRELLPAWLRRRGMGTDARRLAGLPALRDLEAVRAALPVTACYARDQHAALWVLQRALDGSPPARYVTGVVQVARRNPAAETWPVVVALLERMAAAGLPVAGDLRASDAN